MTRRRGETSGRASRPRPTSSDHPQMATIAQRPIALQRNLVVDLPHLVFDVEERPILAVLEDALNPFVVIVGVFAVQGRHVESARRVGEHGIAATEIRFSRVAIRLELLHLAARLQPGEERRILAVEEPARHVVDVGDFHVREPPAELLLVEGGERRNDGGIGRAGLRWRGDRGRTCHGENDTGSSRNSKRRGAFHGVTPWALTQAAFELAADGIIRAGSEACTTLGRSTPPSYTN